MTSKWISLGQALDLAEAAAGADAWAQMKAAVERRELRMIGRDGGMARNVEPQWIGCLATFLDETAAPPGSPPEHDLPWHPAKPTMSDRPEGDDLLFDRHQIALCGVPMSNHRLSRVEVNATDLSSILKEIAGDNPNQSAVIGAKKKRRGPLPKKRNQIAEEMERDFAEIPDTLESDTLETLKSRYQGSLNTLGSARKVALAAIRRNSEKTLKKL